MKTSTVELTIDRSRCALCGGPNDCALARSPSERSRASETPCWCVAETFPVALLERADAQSGGARCICRGCLERSRHESGAG